MSGRVASAPGPWRAVVAVAALLAGVAACSGPAAPRRSAPPAPDVPAASATFVGASRCAGCHAPESAAWQRSHHALAMQRADASSVRGAFDGRTLTHFGVTSRFFRQDGRFRVRTDGPGGALRDYTVAHTFGVAPLQQYLVELPGGRVQALPLCWDTRPAAAGGQRWFHLYPDEPIPHDDALHWTGPQQNWNYMCAECHSTGVRKGYDAAADRYDTTWAEIDVACEACHGPGSRHVAWARTRPGADNGLEVHLRDTRRALWVPDAGAPGGTRLVRSDGSSVTPAAPAEIEACARCHARRSVIRADYVYGRPLLDTHRPALLDAGLYFADGQIDGEVYEYGSFLQSRMYRRGVSCGDCHEPHGAGLRAAGNALCTRCHAAERFDRPAHHHHKAGASCVACHMPTRTYMVVHARRDHSLRIPRPDLSLKIGVPNACNACHRQRSAEWAADAAARWYGGARAQASHYGEALFAGRAGQPGAERALAQAARDRDVPGIARATALSLLARYPGGEASDAIAGALDDPDALVRLGAVAALEAQPADARARLGAPRLRDGALGVRLEAARVLAPLAGTLPGAARADFEAALREFRDAQQANADRPEAHMNLGLMHVQLGQLGQAEGEYREALRLDPSFTPAWVNLADVRRLQGRDDEAEAVLREALERAPRDAPLHHALGLRLVRAQRLDAALAELQRAVALAPEMARYAYVYAVALHESGRKQEARKVLEAARRRHPQDRELAALAAELSAP